MKKQLLLVTTVLVAMNFSEASAQGGNVFENPSNLQILPEDIAPAELSNTMKGFAFALDARCESCHVGEAGQPLTSFDFAADEKPMKASARIMLQMVDTINQQLLAKLEPNRRNGVEVSCMSCHRGQDRPRMIQDILSAELDSGGVDAAIARYQALRDEKYGSHTYDFSALALDEYAGQLAEDGNADAALKLIDMNIVYYPDESMNYFYKGRIQSIAKNYAGAIASFEKLIELAPENAPFLQQQIGQLQALLEESKAPKNTDEE